MTVVPAYGRDYKDTASVKAAWLLGKDFLIQDVGSKDNGRYINKEDHRRFSPNEEVWVRINKLKTKVRVA